MPFTLRQSVLVLSLLTLILPLQACSTNAATGKSIFAGLMSPQDEQTTGDEQHSDIVKQYGGVSDNTALNQYITMIGTKLVPYTERRDVPNYTFTVLNTDDINAFAVPGGYIYVTRGLLNLAQNEAQVAGVVAHELGHIQARHSAQQYSQTAVANIGVGLLGSVLGGATGQLASQVAGFGAQAGLLKYSREDEYEADSLGIRYMQLANYDPTEMAHFLEMLERNTQFENSISKSGGGSQLTFMSTHPSTPARISRAYALASRAPQAQYNLGRDAYLAAIDGTTYGGSTTSGFVRGNDYIHPGIGVRFTVPDGFNIQNGDKQVVAENGHGAIIVFDSGKGTTNDPQAYLAQTWLASQNPSNVETITVNNLPAATGVAQVNTSGGTKDGRFVALAGDGGEFYRLAFLTNVGDQAKYADAFKRSTYSFKALTAADRAALSPNRVRLTTVQSGDTVASLAQKMVVPDHAVDRFCLLNGVTPETALTAGSKMKIVQGH